MIDKCLIAPVVHSVVPIAQDARFNRVIILFLLLMGSLLAEAQNMDEQIVRGGMVLSELTAQGATTFLSAKNDSEHLDDIIALIWYLDDKALKKGQSITEGMFIVEDPHGDLYNVLFRYRAIYGRHSSHFKQVGLPQYGIDMPAGQSLPHGNQHILFGKTDRPGYLFIEPQQHGTQNFFDWLMHMKDYVYYALSGLIDTASSEREGHRHEAVPYTVRMKWDQVRVALPALSDAKSVHAMIEQLNKVSEGLVLTAEQRRVIGQFHGALKPYDHLDIRNGREVIFLQEDL